MKKQREWTVKQLKETGEVSRNLALSLYFSRLGAVICSLNKEGWKIEGAKRGNDYVYTLVEAPTRLVETVDNDTLPPIKVDGRWVPQSLHKKTYVPA